MKTDDDHNRTPRGRRLALLSLGGAGLGALLGASSLIGDLGPGPDACGGAVYGFLLGTVLFVLTDRRRA